MYALRVLFYSIRIACRFLLSLAPDLAPNFTFNNAFYEKHRQYAQHDHKIWIITFIISLHVVPLTAFRAFILTPKRLFLRPCLLGDQPSRSRTRRPFLGLCGGSGLLLPHSRYGDRAKRAQARRSRILAEPSMLRLRKMERSPPYRHLHRTRYGY